MGEETAPVLAGASGFWADTFDADLLAVVPGVLDELGDTADVKLWTHSNPTNGKINCPASWHTDYGLASFFSTLDRAPQPPHHYTRDPLVECTFLEALRDEWVHSSIVVVNGHPVWRPPYRCMERLMCGLRSWGEPLTDEERSEIHQEVLTGLAVAAGALRAITALSDVSQDAQSVSFAKDKRHR